jgi:dTMP kinase
MPRLPFITFEGSEGCGKSTQVRLLAARLTNAGVPLLVTREPGGTPIGETIRHLLQFARESVAMTPEAELLLFEASRSQLVREVIQPALDRGTVVLSDRFADSTTVYQGVARRLDHEMVGHLNAFAVGNCWPDLTFVLDIDAETARARMMRRVRPAAGIDRMEQEPLKFYQAVCAAYRELAAREPHRIKLIDATRTMEELEEEIWEIIATRFGHLSRLIPALRQSRLS